MRPNEQELPDDHYVSASPNSSRLEAVSPQLRLLVPTYVGHRNCVLGLDDNDDFDEPNVPVLIHPAEGVRVVLGTHDYEDYHVPDVMIERRPRGWAIFLHPSGGDPRGYVYFLDDGRCFLIQEFGDDAIEIIENESDIPELDDLPGAKGKQQTPAKSTDNAPPKALADESDNERCSRCEQLVQNSGDWYGDLCPKCADATDGDWVCQVCGREGRFEEMGGHESENPECCGRPCEHLDPDE